MSKDRIIGVIGDAVTGVTGGLTQTYSPMAPSELENQELRVKITNTRSLADTILDINAGLAKKPQSARALRRAEARKLKPKCK